ncbi:MAG TPA: hypothetical protein VHW69_01590 [Rhizomicrobium sp.]|jgi:hypothetical protein|nr:hypothetical protein [Rhizomicrobium sp.]
MRFFHSARWLRALSRALLASAAVCGVAGTAQASVTISDKPTSNMNCSGGVCTPTAKKANLNVTDLANLLAAGDTRVIADSAPKDIEFKAPLSWTSTGRLTLDSYHSIVFEQPVTVAGAGALTITTNDGGSGGDFWFEKKGHVEFSDITDSLIVNGNSYALVRNIRQLAKGVANNPSAFYALAKKYNAIKDGTYTQSPVSTLLTGVFEGLGNEISNLSIDDPRDSANVGLFAQSGGLVHNVSLSAVMIIAEGMDAQAGGLAGSGGNISHSSVAGSVSGSLYAGGLAGLGGTIQYSHSSASVTTTGFAAGGLVGDSVGTVRHSYATGPVFGGDGSVVGGLMGFEEIEGGLNFGVYATGAVRGGKNSAVGGLVGSEPLASIESYSTGAVSGDIGSDVGGFYGDYGSGCLCSNHDYWDIQTSGATQGTGNEGDVRGVVGLKTAKLKSALPIGFEPSIWGQKPNVNGGYPYLLENPPE